MEAGYPHPAGTVRFVRPNANNPYSYSYQRSGPIFEDYLERLGLPDDEASYKEFLKWYKLDEKGAGADVVRPAKRPRVKAEDSQKRRPPSQPDRPAHQTYASIMEAYEAAAPGDVIKLLAGRHMIVTYSDDTEERWESKQSWDNILCKSVQILADDGVPRDRVFVGIAGHTNDRDGRADASAIAVVNADVRIAGITLVSVSKYEKTSFIGVREGGRLWLDGCEMRKVAVRDRFVRWLYSSGEDAEFARGVSVGAGSSCCIRGCVIDGAGGAGIEIAPGAARVVVESSTVTGCAGGSGVIGFGLPWQLVGECGAVEIEACKLLHPNNTFTSNDRVVELVLRDCQIVGNLGPGVSLRALFEEFEIEEGLGQDIGANRTYANALAASIAMERCSVCGNDKEPGVLTSSVGDGVVVVWNKTERGHRYVSMVERGDSDDEGSEEGLGMGSGSEDDGGAD
jgi:hypothetical protein